MKKIIAMLLVLTMAMGLVACGNSGGEETTTGAAENVPASALELMETVWGSYAEDEKFFAMGGDMTNMVDNAPGAYSLEDEGLTANLLVPTEQIANIEEAASLVHGMMLNNFACGAYRMAEGADIAAFAEAMYTSLSTHPYMCGSPEQLIVAVISGKYVVAAYGSSDAIGTFQSKLSAAYPQTEMKYDEAITG